MAFTSDPIQLSERDQWVLNVCNSTGCSCPWLYILLQSPVLDPLEKSVKCEVGETPTTRIVISLNSTLFTSHWRPYIRIISKNKKTVASFLCVHKIWKRSISTKKSKKNSQKTQLVDRNIPYALYDCHFL